MDISMKKPEEVRYYGVPPCPNSPNYDPKMPQPTLAVKKEVRPVTPPLSMSQYRARQEESKTGHTPEEET
ncbi:MAG: hypothetical protein ACK559_08405, partial [bacterium]